MVRRVRSVAWFPLLLWACSAASDGTPRCTSTSDCPGGGACVDNVCVAPVDAGSPDPRADEDGDGLTDVEEGRYDPGGAADTDGDAIPDYLDPDSDGDGISDRIEGGRRDGSLPGDWDRDGIPDFRDLDSDDDGIADSVEGGPSPPDTDGDGLADYVDRDSDGDGISDRQEAVPLAVDGLPADTDGDGVWDFRDLDSDGDGLLDSDEGVEDWDGDGVANYRDPRNDGPAPALTLTAISTTFNTPIGIDYHEPTNSIVLSVNYPTGAPLGFERIEFDGSHAPFSAVAGLTDEVKIATVRSGNLAGFITGDLFVGNGVDGQMARLADAGATVINPWLDLPGTNNGLMRGSIYIDRTGVFGGDLVLVTTLGEVWRVDAAGAPTLLASVGVHLEGVQVVPDAPARYGPLAGKIIAGAEGSNQLFAVAPDGTVDAYTLPVAIEDIDIVPMNENFFGVNFGTGRLLGAPAAEFTAVIGDILLTQELHTATGLYLLRWDGAALTTEEFPLAPGSASVGQWEHVTFAPAGIVEVPPII